MHESETDNLRRDLVRVKARIRLFEAIQDGSDFTKVLRYYLRHAEEISLEGDYTFLQRRAIEKGLRIPSKDEACKEEALRRYALDLKVGIRYQSKDPEILGPIKDLPSLIGVEHRHSLQIESPLLS